MKDKIIKLDRHISTIPKEELKEKLGSLKDSELMRSIIINERDYSTCSYSRTIRSLWYSTVKPVLDKLDKLKPNDNDETKIADYDRKLSLYLTELVKDGQLQYKDLNIIDESRRRDVKSYFSPCRNVVVVVEKDTTYKIVEDLSSLLKCSCLSSKGLPSFGAMESLIQQIVRYSEKPVEDIYFLVLSDYDPAGYLIADTLFEHAQSIVRVRDLDCQIHCERIGILPDQLTNEELYNNWYSPKDKGIEKWMEITGGINGERKGLELDALTPDRIREIFVTSLKKYIRTEDYTDYYKEQYLNGVVRNTLRPYVDKIVDKIIESKKSDVQIKEFNILDFAKNGACYDQYDKVCYMINNNLTDLVGEYFAKVGA